MAHHLKVLHKLSSSSQSIPLSLSSFPQSSKTTRKTIAPAKSVNPSTYKSQPSSPLPSLSSSMLLSTSVLELSTDSLLIPPSPEPRHQPPPLAPISSHPSHSAGLPSSSPLPALKPGLLSAPLPSLPSSLKSSPPLCQIQFDYCDPTVWAALWHHRQWVCRYYGFKDKAGFNYEVLLPDGTQCPVLLLLANRSHGCLCNHLL
ncbi:hypothetical protein HMI56_001262 [Coelomomyces lativittatus]|nr:hypothetical protein HMI56_001262 [Coelomomyces lativittatus]